MIPVMLRAAIAIILAGLIGCDRAAPSSAKPVTLSKRTFVQIEPITQLTPNRVAHVAYDRQGRVLYTIETAEGSDGVISVSESGIPRATRLTSANILAALGETVGGTG